MQRGGGRRQLQLPGGPGASAMDLFPDGAFVRLQNRARQTYLTADDDGEGVSLRSHGPAFSLNAVWRVHRVQNERGDFVLLQGAAYGRYLGIADGQQAPSGCSGHRAVQRDYDGPDLGFLTWWPFRIAGDEAYVRLRHAATFEGNLRANGRFRFWHTAATIDTSEAEPRASPGTMMQWTVRTFQLGQGLPPLPRPTANLGARSGLFWRRRPEADQRRAIRHVRANDEGDFDQDYNNWPMFPFYGRSVFNLRTQVGLRQPGEEDGSGITLAVRPGMQGRLTPLVTDLPRSVDTMDVVVFNTGSQGAQNLVYPDIL